MTDVTQILQQLEKGDSDAVEKLLPLLYDELRQIAASKLAGEGPGNTLDATSLVHEAYIRLFGSNSAKESHESRAHFLAAAAIAMRRVLIDRARRRKAEKRGGGWVRNHMELSEIPSQSPDSEVLALQDALERLAELDPIKAKLVELRYFGGLTGDEAAQILGISPATADRHWAYARAWLQLEVRGN